VVGDRRASKFITGFGKRLTERQHDTVLGSVMQLFLVLADEPVPLDLSMPEPPHGEPALLTVDEVADTFFAGILSARIEEWMAFPLPEQGALVRRRLSGPSRIRGTRAPGKSLFRLVRSPSAGVALGGADDPGRDRGRAGRLIPSLFCVKVAELRPEYQVPNPADRLVRPPVLVMTTAFEYPRAPPCDSTLEKAMVRTHTDLS